MATVDDANALTQMRWSFRIGERPGKAVHSETEFVAACSDFIKAGIKGGGWVFWIAEEDDKIVSHICIQIVSKLPRLDRLDILIGHIHNVVTIREYRNRGIGSELMRRVLGWASDFGILDLMVHPTERSIPFYKRAGFLADNEMMHWKFPEQP